MKKKNNRAGKITMSGNTPRPGQKGPATIVLTQPKRFGIDIADYMSAIRSFENVDYSRRYKLYDLFSDILMDTHLSSVIEKRKNSVLSSAIEFQRNGKPDKRNEDISIDGAPLLPEEVRANKSNFLMKSNRKRVNHW